MREGEKTETEELHCDKFTTHVQHIKELTLQMASAGRILGTQMASLHNTVCKETNAAGEYVKENDNFSPELYDKLRDRTSNLESEVRVLDGHLEQLRKLLLLKQTHGNGVKEVTDIASCQENSETQQLSFKELRRKLKAGVEDQHTFHKEEKEYTRKEERLDCLLQSGEDLASLERQYPLNESISNVVNKLDIDKKELENDSNILRQQSRIIRQKLYEKDIVDEDAICLSDADCERGNPPVENSSELASLRKERKLLLATVLKLQNQTKAGNGTREVSRIDAAIQCKMNVLGQIDNQGISLSSELEGLRKALAELQGENGELEAENKALDEENSMLVEEKRSLEDSVNKLKSQLTDALDSSLDEMEHLHQVAEELQDKLQLAEAKNERLREGIVELSEKNSEHLTSVVEEIERKDSLEDVIDFLAREVERLLKINNLAVENTSEPLVSWDSMRKMHNSSLLSEIKACKELIDSQRDQIRQLQVDKRDVEDRYSNLKRELFILRSKREDKRILRQQNADEGKGNMQTYKNSHERYEFLKQEILRLTTRQTELEDLIATLKSDNSNLEEEKVCLLDSLYHQVERNEWLEVKIDNLRSVIGKQQSCTTNEHGKDENENELENEDCFGDSLGQSIESMKRNLEGSFDSLAKSEITKTKPVDFGDQLHRVQSSVLEIENQKEILQQKQQKSSKTEKELRELITLLKSECAVVKSQLEKAQQFSGTLQECLREAHEEKQEILDSLDEITEEKAALESKVQMSENQLNELNERHQLLKDELASVRDNDKVNAKQQMAAISAKLVELCKSLCSDAGDVQENSTLRTEEVTPEELETTMVSKLETVSRETSLLRKELQRVKSDREKLKTGLETLQTEKVALQKFVRELDEKRRQVKSFVMKLTEEKEFISEQMDEIKQQKNNLADALENVYQSKENLQCKLEDALSKQQEYANSCADATTEMQSLKNSLCRLAEERDTLKGALLKEKEEVCALQKSQAKLKEKITASQAEADQSVHETRDLVNTEESQTIRRLRAEKNELQERLEKLRMNLSSSPEGIEAEICHFGSSRDSLETPNVKSCEGDIQASVALEYGSSASFQTQATIEDVSCEEATKTTSELQVSDNSVDNDKNASKSSMYDALQVRYNEKSAENKVLLEHLKRKAEDIELLNSRFDSISVEKDNIQREQERVAKENERLLHNLEEAKEEEKKLKIRVEEILQRKRELKSENDELSMCDVQASLKEKVIENEQLQQELQKRGDVCKELKESLQLANMRNRSLESEANESWEKATALEKSLKFFREKNDSLNKRISLLQKDNKKQTLVQDKLKSVAEQCEQQKNEISRIVKTNELLENQLEEKSKELKEIKEILENTVKEKNDLDGLAKEMKNKEELTETNYQQILHHNRILEETLLKLRAEKCEIEEILRKVRQDLESTVNEQNAEISSLKDSLKATQDHLDATEEDLELAEEERDELKDQVERITEKERLLRQQIELKSQEDGNVAKSIEKLTKEKDLLQQTLEASKTDCNKVKCELEDLKAQTDSICSYFARATKRFLEPQEKPSDISQYVRDSIEAFLSERDSLVTSLAEEKTKLERAEVDSNELRDKLAVLREDLAKAEIANRQARDDNKQLLSERTELATQLQEALGERGQAKEGTRKHAREDARLSREISDVRSLIEKLSLQKEKLGAALVHKENQIAAVTAAASEKAKKLEEKENEARSISNSKDEVSVALMAARDSCEKVHAELDGEQKRVASLTQELDNTKEQLGRSQDEKSDLKISVSQLDKENTTLQKSLATAKRKSTDLEARVQKLEEENAKIKQRRSELEADLKTQTESLATSQQLNKEIEEKWIKELNEKESQLRLVNEDMEKSRMTELNLKEIVDDLRSKINELESRYCQAEKAHQDMIQEKNNLKKKLDFEIEAKKSSNTKTTDLEKALHKYREENKDLKKCIASIDKEKHSLKTRIKDAEEKKKEIEQRLVELTSEKKTVEDDLEMTKSKDASLRDELSTKTSSLLESEKKVNKLNNVIKGENQKFAQLREERDALKKTLTVTESELRQAETRIGVTKEQNVKLKEKLEVIEKEMTSLNSAVDIARRKEEDLRYEMKTQRGHVEKELEEKKVECNTLKENLEREGMKFQQETQQRKQLEEKFGKFREEHEALKKSAEDLRGECDAQTEKLKDSLKEKCEAERKLELTSEQTRGVQEELLKLKEECARLKNSSQELRTECSALNNKLKRALKERSQTDEELKQEREEKRRVKEELLHAKEEYTTLQNSCQQFEKDLRLEYGTLKEKFENSLKEKLELEKRLVFEGELLKLEKHNVSVKNSAQTFAVDTEDAGELVKAVNEVNESMIPRFEEELFSMAMGSQLTTVSDRNSLEDELAKERDISSDLRDQLEETMDEKDELEEIVEELREKNKKLQREIDSVILEKDSLEDKVDENTKFFKEQIGALNDEKKELSRKLDVLLKDKSSLSGEITAKDLYYGVALDDGKKLEDAFENGKQEISRLSNELQKSEENLKELLNKFEESSLRNQDVMDELVEIKNENSKLRLVLEETTLAKQSSELESRTVEKDQDHRLKPLQAELEERDKNIASLQREIIEHKRTRDEEERNFSEREANLAAARQEFYRMSREKWEEEERMESVRRTNNRLQEALKIAKDETNQLRKQLRDVNDRNRLLSANNFPDASVDPVRVKNTSVGKRPERGVEKVTITSSEVPELSQVPPAIEKNEHEEAPTEVIPLEYAKKELALLESQVQELRSELRKARDQVFDLQHELSDASRAMKQQERLHQQERERYQAVIDEIEKDYNKFRSDFSSLIAMEKKRSSFTTVKDLKRTLRKAEADMLEAISKTADFLRRAKNEVRENRIESENENSEKLSRRSRSLIVTSAEKTDLLRQIDDICKERERLEKKLKRAEGTKLLLQQILDETLAEFERFKRLVDFGDQQGQEHETNSSKQIAEITTKELETERSYLTSTDSEEAQLFKKRLEELRKNIRELEGCLEEERSKGQVSVVDQLRVNKTLHAEKRALQQLLKESENKSQALQTKLELAQKEKTADVEKEIAGVRREVAMLRNLSYDEREEKNSLKRENAELKRVLLESKRNDAPAANEKEESEEMLKRAKEQITELLTGKEALEKHNVLMQRELRIIEKNYEERERKYSDLANKYRAMEEKWKGMTDRCAKMESELQVKNENLDVLNKELTDLKTEFVALEERWKSAEEERMKLVEDAHSFKLTLEKKNQDLLSIVESKKHEVISLEAKIEGLVTLQRKLEGDVQSLVKEKDDALSLIRSLESSKERTEANTKELQNQIEQILLDKSDQDDLNVRLKNLLSENKRLDALNKSLEATLHNLKKGFQEKMKDAESLLHERQELASKVKQLEIEKGKEAFLKEQLVSQLEEKDREMTTKTTVLSSRLDSVIKETENLKTSSGKMEQMGIEFSRLEDENTHLIEAVEKVREENVTLKKENDLLRRACQQLRARKPVPEEKLVTNFQGGEAAGRKPVLRKDSLDRLTVHHPTGKNDGDFVASKAGQSFSSRKPPDLPHGIRLSRGSVVSLPAITEEEIRQRRLREYSAKRKWSQGTPPVNHHQWTSVTEAEIKPHSAASVFKGPSPTCSDGGSNRSSEAEHTVCARNFYCSPILSLVDTCPLHRNPSIERPPSQCPICKKDRRRSGTVPKEFVSLEKYV